MSGSFASHVRNKMHCELNAGFTKIICLLMISDTKYSLGIKVRDKVHGLTRHCPLTHWTFSMDHCSSTLAGQRPYPGNWTC